MNNVIVCKVLKRKLFVVLFGVLFSVQLFSQVHSREDDVMKDLGKMAWRSSVGCIESSNDYYSIKSEHSDWSYIHVLGDLSKNNHFNNNKAHWDFLNEKGYFHLPIFDVDFRNDTSAKDFYVNFLNFCVNARILESMFYAIKYKKEYVINDEIIEIYENRILSFNEDLKDLKRIEVKKYLFSCRSGKSISAFIKWYEEYNYIESLYRLENLIEDDEDYQKGKELNQALAKTKKAVGKIEGVEKNNGVLVVDFTRGNALDVINKIHFLRNMPEVEEYLLLTRKYADIVKHKSSYEVEIEHSFGTWIGFNPISDEEFLTKLDMWFSEEAGMEIRVGELVRFRVGLINCSFKDVSDVKTTDKQSGIGRRAKVQFVVYGFECECLNTKFTEVKNEIEKAFGLSNIDDEAPMDCDVNISRTISKTRYSIISQLFDFSTTDNSSKQIDPELQFEVGEWEELWGNNSKSITIKLKCSYSTKSRNITFDPDTNRYGAEGDSIFTGRNFDSFEDALSFVKKELIESCED